MADQARELNEMMNRYRVHRDGGESQSVSAPSSESSSVERTAVASKAPAAERRTKNRPWSGKRERPAAAAAGAANGSAVPAAAAARKPASNADTDWQEF
jgi:hypothetical protein